MVIDRIEGELAVVELAVGSFRIVRVSAIEGRARDGAVLVETAPGVYRVDEDETARRTAAVTSRARALFVRGDRSSGGRSDS